MHESANKDRSWVAGGLWHVRAVFVAVGLIVNPYLAEGQVPLARSFERFEYDSGSVEGVWVELRSAYAQFDRSDRLSSSADVVGVEGLLAYGGDGWELGLRLPYVNVDGEDDVDGLGDMQLYLKKIMRTEWIHVGAGIDLSLPTGDDDKGLGTGDLGGAPFGTLAVPLSTMEIRAHVGHLFVSDDGSYFSTESPDVLFYGVGLVGSPRDEVILRLEFLGSRLYYPSSANENAFTLQPGVDVRIPLSSVDLFLRSSLTVGLNDIAPNWGVGVGFTLLLPTQTLFGS